MATTPNYSFSVYNSTDTDVRFLDFRVATAGSQSTSNFYVIDTVLKQHSDAIDSINATPSAFVVKGTYSAGSLYTASVANYPGYKNEQLIVLSLNQKNTGAVQININGTTNKDVMKYGSDGVLKAVDAGDFVANSPVLCLYDGTQFVVIGITSASSITVTGEAGDILQIADDGTIESSGKKAAQPNGIATLDENGNVVQVANMANSAAAVYSGAPVSIAYAGAQRIASITAYGESTQGGTTEAPKALDGINRIFASGKNLLSYTNTSSVESGITKTVNQDRSITLSGTATRRVVVYLEKQDTRNTLPAGSYTLGIGTELPSGCGVLLGDYTDDGKYVNNIVRIPVGQSSASFTTTQKTYNLDSYFDIKSGTTVDITIYPMLNLGSTALPYEPYQGSVTPLPIPRPLRRVGDVKDKCVTRQKHEGAEKLVVTYNVGYIASYAGESITTAWISSTGALSTGAEVAYVLSSPEVYATDPLDIDNAAGPLTVVTGGQVEVKMTDFVTDRTPAFLNKLDKTGDGSDVTVTFTEAATDTDIASGDKLSILFGKILKRFTNILNGTTKVGYATKADTDNLGNQITETYANSLDVANNTIVLKNKTGESLSTITVPYANSAGNVAESIKKMGIAVQTASPYAWFLNYTGTGNRDGARKYYAAVYADTATNATNASNAANATNAGNASKINGHALNMALNGTSLSITW
jgi:hypothetical protein